MSIADKNSWIMCGSVLKKMKKTTLEAPVGVLREVGLKNQHSYTVLDVREVVLDNGELEYLVFLMNPTGNFYFKDDEIWKGDWGPRSSKWTAKVRKQLNYYITEEDLDRAREESKANLKGSRAGKKKKKGKKKKGQRRDLDETGVQDEFGDDEMMEPGEIEAEGGKKEEEDEMVLEEVPKSERPKELDIDDKSDPGILAKLKKDEANG